ncbi:MAG: hypothetical protein AAF657_32140, partial [Acidobacteriota bacterium]
LKLRGHITEMLYLKERCCWAPLAIHLNGERISGGQPLADAAGRIELKTPGTSLVAGFTHEHWPARLLILDQGVWFATHKLDHLPFRFTACVESGRLLKDASQRDVVRNRAYDEVQAAVSEAFYRALAKFAHEGCAAEEDFRWLLLHPATLPLIRRAIAAIQASGVETPESQAVAAVPLWPAARQPSLDLSLLDLLHLRVSHGRVGWTKKAYTELERQDQPPLAVISSPEERSYLAELFGDGFYAADSELQHELVRRRNVERWRRRRMTPEIPVSAGSLISRPLATAEVQGQVGIFLDPFRHSAGQGRFPVWWIKDGGLLHKAAITPVVRGFTAALEADFEPADDYARVEVDRLFVRVVLELARALGPLMNQLAAESRRLPGFPEQIRGCLISYLGIDWTRDGLTEFLQSFGVTGEEPLAYARSLVEEDPVANFAAADLAGEAAPAMARLPLFTTMAGGRLALRDLARAGQSWRYLPKPHSGPLSSAEDNVLHLDDSEIAVLRQVFPEVALQDHSYTYHRPAAFARHMRQKPPVPPSGCVEEVVVEVDGLRGRFGLRHPRSPGTPVFAQLQLLKHDRRLDDLRFRLPIGPIAGMINDDKLSPTPDWSGVEHDGTVERIRSLVLRRITGLLVDLSGSPLPMRGHRRQLLLNAATRVLATEAALDDWSAADLLPPEVTDPDWAEALAGALETVALFEDLDGRPIDLRSIRRELERHDLLLYHLADQDPLPQAVRSRAGGRAVLRLSPDDHDALARIFGSYRLSDARRWLLAGRWGPELAVPEPDRLESADAEVPIEGGNGPAGELGLAGELTAHREPAEPGRDQRLEHDPPASAPDLAEDPPETDRVARELPMEDGLQSREARFLQALCAELRHAGRGHVQLLDDKNVDRIALGNPPGGVLATCQAQGVTIDRRHPLVERLLVEPEAHPVQMAFLASAVYTAMNHFWQEIEDDHERAFHRALIERLVDERPRSSEAPSSKRC